MPSFYRWGNWGLEKLSGWPTAMLTVEVKIGIVSWLPILCFLLGYPSSSSPGSHPRSARVGGSLSPDPLRERISPNNVLGESPTQRCSVGLLKVQINWLSFKIGNRHLICLLSLLASHAPTPQLPPHTHPNPDLSAFTLYHCFPCRISQLKRDKLFLSA